MADVIDLDAMRARRETTQETSNPLLAALDELGCALADHGHTWTERQVSLYETAVAYAKGIK